MRQRRFYKQFALTLLHFAHDRYAGTDIPKNFSSRVRLVDFERGENREVLISMNDPLRYRGFTFYQAGFDNNDKTTILQVVKNPAMLLPYIACGLVGLGLLVQFSMHLFGFVRKQKPMKKLPSWIIWLIVGLTIAYVLAPLGQRDTRGGFEMQKFGRLPVLLNGRIKPLDTVARNSLLIIHGKQTVASEQGSLTPIDWLAEVLMQPSDGGSRKIFVIRSPETLAAIGRSDPTEKYFSFRDLDSAPPGDRATGRARGEGRGAGALAFSARHHQALRTADALSSAREQRRGRGHERFQSAGRRSAEEHPSLARSR